MPADKKARFDDEMDKLKSMLDSGALTKEEFSQKAKEVYDRFAD